MSKGGGGTNTVEKADPWGGLQPYLKDVYSQAQNWYRNEGQSQQYFPGKTYAEFTPAQELGQEAALGYANILPSMLSPMYGANQQMLSGQNMMTSALQSPLMQSGQTLQAQMTPQGNPYLEAMVKRAGTSATDIFNDAMQGVRGEAAAAGHNLGDSGYLRGLNRASRNLGNTLENITTQMYGGSYQADQARALQAAMGAGSMYGQGLDIAGTQQGRAMALAPSTYQMGLMPSQVYGAVGGEQQAQAQRGIDEQMARYMYNQQAPLQALQGYTGVLAGIPISGGTATSTTTGNYNKMLGGLGGGLSGYGLASTLGLSNPLLYGLGGAALGLFG